MGIHMAWLKVWTEDSHGERPQRRKSRSWAWSESGGHSSPEVSFPFPGSTPGMWTVPGMTRSRNYWPSSITGRYSTEPARWSGWAVSCWSSMGTSTARTLASSGTARERVSLQLGEVCHPSSSTPPHPGNIHGKISKQRTIQSKISWVAIKMPQNLILFTWLLGKSTILKMLVLIFYISCKIICNITFCWKS